MTGFQAHLLAALVIFPTARAVGQVAPSPEPGYLTVSDFDDGF
jgi:hypothetical protein